MDNYDFKRDPLYKATTQPAVVTVPSRRFIMIDGAGAPDASGTANIEFQDAMQVLFGLVYTIKFWDKKHVAPPGSAKFTMPPVEALWWTTNGTFDLSRPDDWRWTVMFRVPNFVTPGYFAEIVRACIEAKQSDMFNLARLEDFEEGECVQILHIGPYRQEAPNIQRLHEFAAEQGYKLRGKHHELYLGDPRLTAPEKLKTILRQPVANV